MRINTNLSALNAYRNLAATDTRLNKSLERLSSGLRITRAADDAAGLAISEKMRSQIRGINQAMRNAMDGISLMQTAEGALTETHSILQRMRELSVQASSDTVTSSDRIEIQREVEQLIAEMDRIASSTEFNAKKLLDGSSAALTSTSELNTRIFMRGGLRTIDQFGQKAVGGGNYRLEIDATPGRGEVQKTDIMKTKHDVGLINVETTTPGSPAGMEELQAFQAEIGGTIVGSLSLDDAAIAAITDALTITFVVDGGPEQVMTIDAPTMTLITTQQMLLDAINNGEFTDAGDVLRDVADWDGLEGAYATFGSNLRIISDSSGEESSVRMSIEGPGAGQVFGASQSLPASTGTAPTLKGGIVITDAFVEHLNVGASSYSFNVHYNGREDEVVLDFAGDHSEVNSAEELLGAINAQLEEGNTGVSASYNEEGRLVFSGPDATAGPTVTIGGADAGIFLGANPVSTPGLGGDPSLLTTSQHWSDDYVQALVDAGLGEVTFTIGDGSNFEQVTINFQSLVEDTATGLVQTINNAIDFDVTAELKADGTIGFEALAWATMEIDHGSEAEGEILQINLNGATGGTFTLEVDGVGSLQLDATANATTIQNAINANLLSLGLSEEVAVTRVGDMITINIASADEVTGIDFDGSALTQPVTASMAVTQAFIAPSGWTEDYSKVGDVDVGTGFLSGVASAEFEYELEYTAQTNSSIYITGDLGNELTVSYTGMDASAANTVTINFEIGATEGAEWATGTLTVTLEGNTTYNAAAIQGFINGAGYATNPAIDLPVEFANAFTVSATNGDSFSLGWEANHTEPANVDVGENFLTGTANSAFEYDLEWSEQQLATGTSEVVGTNVTFSYNGLDAGTANVTVAFEVGATASATWSVDNGDYTLTVALLAESDYDSVAIQDLVNGATGSSPIEGNLTVQFDGDLNLGETGNGTVELEGGVSAQWAATNGVTDNYVYSDQGSGVYGYGSITHAGITADLDELSGMVSGNTVTVTSVSQTAGDDLAGGQSARWAATGAVTGTYTYASHEAEQFGETGEIVHGGITATLSALTGMSSTDTVTVTSTPDDGTPEIQTLSLNGATGGNFVLEVAGGASTGSLAYDISAADLKAAIEGLAEITGEVTVDGADGEFTITFALVDEDSNLQIQSGSLTGPVAGADMTVTAYVEAVNEVQTITLVNAAGGTFTLTFEHESVSDTTIELPFNATTAQVQTALRALDSIDGAHVNVSGIPGAWVVEFVGDLAGQNVDAIEVDTTNLEAAEIELGGDAAGFLFGAGSTAVEGTDAVGGGVAGTIELTNQDIEDLEGMLTFTVTINGVDHVIELDMDEISERDELLAAINEQLEGTGASATFNSPRLQIVADNPASTVQVGGTGAVKLFGGPSPAISNAEPAGVDSNIVITDDYASYLAGEYTAGLTFRVGEIARSEHADPEDEVTYNTVTIELAGVSDVAGLVSAIRSALDAANTNMTLEAFEVDGGWQLSLRGSIVGSEADAWIYFDEDGSDHYELLFGVDPDVSTGSEQADTITGTQFWSDDYVAALRAAGVEKSITVGIGGIGGNAYNIDVNFADIADVDALVAHLNDNLSDAVVDIHEDGFIRMTADANEDEISVSGDWFFFFGANAAHYHSTGEPASITGSKAHTNASIASMSGELSFTVDLEGQTLDINLNMSVIGSISALEAAINAQLSDAGLGVEASFSPDGRLTLKAGDYDLSLSVYGDNVTELFGGGTVNPPLSGPGFQSTMTITDTQIADWQDTFVFTIRVDGGPEHEIVLDMSEIETREQLVAEINRQLQEKGLAATASFNNLQIVADDPDGTIIIGGPDAGILFGGLSYLDGTDAQEEIQILGLQGATGGSYTLSADGNITTLAWNANAAAIRTALINNLGFQANQVTVTGGTNGEPYRITFSTDLGAPSGLTFNGDDLEGTLTASDTQQTVTVNADGGTFSLTLFQGTADEVTTADIAYDAAPAEMQSAINIALNDEDRTVTVEAGENEGEWIVTFDGTDFAGMPQPEMRINTADLIGVGRIGQVAYRGSAIYDIDRFWDANGNFLVQDPQTINLVQGDGKKTSFTIFGSDTINDIEQKMNRAIHEGLGQSQFNDEADSYVTYVTREMADEHEDGFFTVAGTFIIQSAITGSDGEIRFSGDEGVINALSLTRVQNSKENEFLISVTDAHDSSRVIAENNRIVGNLLVGVVHENVDVKFNPMAGVRIDASDGAFQWVGEEVDNIFIHLADNTMVFHIGANPGQDVGAAIGDMSAEALGINNILVTNRISANRAITQIDYAIQRVSSERAKLGAVQNRLEHTINNLAVAAENLSAAESRVRDLDFALEMVEFTRNQIMMQAGTSMLAQANMMPQSVLMLLQ